MNFLTNPFIIYTALVHNYSGGTEYLHDGGGVVTAPVQF